MLGTDDQYQGQMISTRDRLSVLGTEDQYKGQMISTRDRRSVQGTDHAVTLLCMAIKIKLIVVVVDNQY